MAYNPNPPTIPLDQIIWDETGEDDDPKSRLHGHIRIGDCDLHVEALEVLYTNDREQSVAYLGRQQIIEQLQIEEEVPSFTTLQINGREYLLYITPFA